MKWLRNNYLVKIVRPNETSAKSWLASEIRQYNFRRKGRIPDNCDGASFRGFNLLVVQQNCGTGDQLSYGEFIQHTVRLAAGLAELGLGRGDTVPVMGEPRATFLPTGLAVILTGAAYSPIELECGRAILTHKLNLTTPKFVICTPLFWKKNSDVIKSLKFIKTIICFDAVKDIELSVEEMVSSHVGVDEVEPALVSGEDIALIVYSSGTTGMSKGVLLTHINCIARSDSQRYYDFKCLQTAFHCTELCTSYSIFGTYPFICAGKRFVYTNKKPDFKTLRDYQVDTLVTTVGTVETLLDDDEEDTGACPFKIVYSVGAPLYPALQAAYKKRFPNLPVLMVYGATETGFITAQEPSSAGLTDVGLALQGVTLKVVDIDTRETLGPNQRGEICVRSPLLMKGYLGATAPYLDEQGFFLTGDLGYYDEHKRFYVVSRLKDIISVSDYKISPEDVEAVLLWHPAVRETAVVGKPVGNSLTNEAPTAFVVLRPGTTATEAELVDHVAQGVTWYMRLAGGVRFVSELPRNLSGKVLRRRLREMLETEADS